MALAQRQATSPLILAGSGCFDVNEVVKVKIPVLHWLMIADSELAR
jgi:hypothetical protein